jgi:hypothetical protein
MRTLKYLPAVFFFVLLAGQSWAAAVQWGVKGHYYEFMGFNLPETNGLTWTEANAAALGKGGYLATITSAEENSFVDSLLPPGEDRLTTAWLGGAVTGEYYTWSWVAGPETGTVFFYLTNDFITRVDVGYTNWCPDPSRPVFHPDNLTYLLMNSSGWVTSGYWNNASAEYRSGYVVEYNANPVPVPATLPLLASGLGALGFRLRRKNR